MIKAIIFDFGGVCFSPGNSEQLIKEAFFNSRLPKLKLLTLILDFKKRKMIKDVVHEFNAGCVDEMTFWEKIKMITHYDFNEKELKKIILSLHRPIKPVMNIVKRLEKRYKLGLLTNNNSWLEDLNKKYKFYRYFDEVVNSFDVKASKPSRKIYYIILKRLGVKPKECIFIDDKKENIDAAKKIGMKVILYKNPKNLIKQLKSFGVEI
jgi:putative hydrolase of the HAD superfamily